MDVVTLQSLDISAWWSDIDRERDLASFGMQPKTNASVVTVFPVLPEPLANVIFGHTDVNAPSAIPYTIYTSRCWNSTYFTECERS